MGKKFSLKTKQKFRECVKLDTDSGCWLWIGTKCKDYGMFYVPETQRSVRAHKWLWELVHGPVPQGYELDHLCHNKTCVNPNHLEAVTHWENMKRAALRGVWAGENNSQAKRTTEEVMAIKFLNQYLNIPARLLSEKMQIPERSIYSILAGESWQSVELPLIIKQELVKGEN